VLFRSWMMTNKETQFMIKLAKNFYLARSQMFCLAERKSANLLLITLHVVSGIKVRVPLFILVECQARARLQLLWKSFKSWKKRRNLGFWTSTQCK